MTALDELTHEDRLQLARDLRTAEAKERELERLRKAHEQEQFRLNIRIKNGERRRERLRAELAKLDDECAPFEATLNEAAPDAADRTYDHWHQAMMNAKENLAEHDRRRGFLRRVIGEIDSDLDELRELLNE